jgi:hypothetical protein
MAARWASVFGLAEPSAQGGGWRLQLHGATLDFVRGAARGDGIAGFALALADRPAVLDAARSRGLPVQGNRVDFLGAWLDLRTL